MNRRGRPATEDRPQTLAADLRADVRHERELHEAKSGRFAKYHDDPVGFFIEVLGREPWSRQQEVAEAVAVDDLVSVVSGHGVGKTFLLAGLALWFWCTRGPGCRVFLTSTKEDQTEEGVWHELRLLYLRAKVPLGGTLPKLGSTGLVGPEEQQIIIITADQAEGMQGLRAPEMMIIADEASGIEERLFVALWANLSGGGKLLLIGNPTKSEGTFFESQKETSEFRRFHISSLESPNVIARTKIIPGLVTWEWVEARKRDWGEESALYKIRILGLYIVNEAGKPLPWVFIEKAQERYAKTPARGTLAIGVDPAGPGQFGDETAISVVRGDKHLETISSPTWDENTTIRQVLDMLTKWRSEDECPRVVIDSNGPIGSRLLGRFKAVVDTVSLAKRFVVFGVRASERAIREPLSFTSIRDELFENLARWIKADGAILPDAKLAVELNTPNWVAVGGPKGLLKLLDKKEIKKIINRSPDRADSLALAVWVPRDAEARPPAPPPAPQAARTQNVYQTHRTFDPYTSLNWARPR